ncbi:site-specific integrase [Sulfurirhabdus autotrophica]|uniref:Integrase n=1 Tax=Sulfurirhabdus autotrophica TaxID=1706046 RepID=A0A4R3Y2R2_9PROT|nr:site-specific integrase [Sulfurirhabdus autotrophica]TCV85867.1 integrase [Sulfurirhabdus autotrophica]
MADFVRVEKGIYKRGEYSFQVKMMVNGHRVTETFDTILEARAFRDSKNVAKALDPDFKRVVASRIKKQEAASFTISKALDRYLREVTVLKKGAAEEKYKIGKLKRYDIAKIGFYSCSADDIAMFLSTLKDEGMSDNGRRKYALILSHLYNIALKRWRMAVSNPASSIELPSNGPSRDRRLESGEEVRFYAQLGKARNKFVLPITKLAVETAMRRGELLSLQWKDITYHDDGTGTAALYDTKNGENRVVPLSTKAVAVLKGLTRPIKGGQVFNVDKVQLRAALAAALKRARKEYALECEKIGRDSNPGFLRNLRFHDLRHEATSRLFERGVFDSMEVASITGHKTLQMLKRYTHLRAEDLARKMG